MSSQPMLKFIAGREPIFNIEYAILSAPVRHTFMMATVWYLNKQMKSSDFQILEIGSWVGASALSWAEGLETHNNAKGTITCVDAWKPFFDRQTHKDDVYVKMEHALSTDAAYQLFLHNVSTIPAGINCQHLRGQSDNILPLLNSEAFDVVFIDADHAYTPVLKDIKNSLRLVKEGGIICGDDLNLQLSEVDEALTKENAEKDLLRDSKLNRNYHPGVTLAVAEVFGEVSAWGGFWAMQKKGGQWVKISMKDMPVAFPKHFPADAVEKAKSHYNDLVVI